MPEAASYPVLQTYQGLSFYGRVMALVNNTNSIISLLGFGNTFFVGYSLFITRKANGTTTAPRGESVAITGYVSETGQFTYVAPTVPLAEGDEVLILNPALIASAGVIISNLQGNAPVSNSIIANWQAAEQNLVQIGAVGRRYKIHALTVDITNTIGNITVRLHKLVNGIDRVVFPPVTTTFSVAGGTTGLEVINGTWEITGVLTVTCQSDNAGDNGVAIAYEYATETML